MIEWRWVRTELRAVVRSTLPEASVEAVTLGKEELEDRRMEGF